MSHEVENGLTRLALLPFPPDATVEADAGTLAALVYEGRSLAQARRTGDVKIEGDEEAVARFLALFPLPEPAAAAAGV